MESQLYNLLFFFSFPRFPAMSPYPTLLLFPKNYKGNSQNRHVGTKKEAENTQVLFFLQTYNKRIKKNPPERRNDG